MVLKTLESPLDWKEIQPVHPKGDQSWVFIGRTDIEAETPILWPPDVKNWLIWKDPDVGWAWCTETTQRDGWGGRKEEGSGWGTHVYLWWIHVDIWQNQYNIVKLKNKIKYKIKKKWKDPDAEKDWGWEEKWTTEDKMAGWHHQLNGHEFG